MDDEAKQLLREMLDILRQDHEILIAESKRNAEWIDESRKYNDDSMKLNQEYMRVYRTGWQTHRAGWQNYALSFMVIMVLAILLFEIFIAIRIIDRF